jgi:hypothetical protein
MPAPGSDKPLPFPIQLFTRLSSVTIQANFGPFPGLKLDFPSKSLATG